MSLVKEYVAKHNMKHRCQYCNKFISLINRPSLICYASSNRIPVFCNRSCHGKFFAKQFFMPGKQHVAYKNGSSAGYNWRYTRLSIEQLGNQCNRCDSKKRIVTHYKDWNPRNNPLDGSNWERLCRSCLAIESWLPRKLSSEERQQRIHLQRVQIPDGWITTIELREVLHLSRERIRQLRNDGRIPYHIVGKRTYIYNRKKLLEQTWILKAISYNGRKILRTN